MGGKLFLKIVILIVIFIVLMNFAKCLRMSYCPMAKRVCSMGVAAK